MLEQKRLYLKLTKIWFIGNFDIVQRELHVSVVFTFNSIKCYKVPQS